MNENLLNGIGRIWKKTDFPENIVEDETYKVNQRQIMKTLSGKRPRSVVVTGEVGVGKSVLIEMVSRDLAKQNWTIFVASASQVMAGQKYIGELEQQVLNILNELRSKKNSLWVIPNFHDTFYVGRTSLNPLGILDQILATVDKGEVLILGESTNNQYERVLTKKPLLRSAVTRMQVFPSDSDFTDKLAAEWAKNHKSKKLWGKVDHELMKEVGTMARQFLPKQEEPGILFDFLKATTHYFEHEPPKTGLKPIHFLQTLSDITGFPEELLDDKQTLDLDELKDVFNQRIIGQPEAVNQLVERIAMIKAGLTDPQKPLGVFLFVGPTGTGKTEVAKTVSKYLFSDEDRMIRFDMSELQTADDLIRMTGGYKENSDADSLTSLVKKQPFSIILLDEFEKAHVRIWDLFLQVFDDGRLTDDVNGTVDFRNTIIILTSNTGASNKIPPRVGFGESEDNRQILNRSINKSLQQVFRPEFLNRIDRIVHFNPLDASAVRKILKIELNKVLQRRGFRQRDWEVEWEDSALNLLMKHGYDPEMGARPMKRAIEQLVLAPLAITIVTNNFPSGQQFLFVSERGGELKVDFVDPKAPKLNWKDKEEKIKSQKKTAKTLTLNQIVIKAQGKLSEREAILREWDRLEQSVTASKLDELKDGLMQEMAAPGFWDENDENKAARIQVLTDIEYLDRFQYSFSSLSSLVERIAGDENASLSYPSDLLRSMAGRLRLLLISHQAYKNHEMQDCFVRLEFTDFTVDKLAAGEIMEKQTKMYCDWAKARRMQFKILQSGDERHNATVFWFGGYGARQIMDAENGLHIWEVQSPVDSTTGKSPKPTRYRLKVVVFPYEGPVSDKSLLMSDYKKLSAENTVMTEIVRTYKLGDKPLIKDHVSGWKTARLDLVLKGGFDVMGS